MGNYSYYVEENISFKYGETEFRKRLAPIILTLWDKDVVNENAWIKEIVDEEIERKAVTLTMGDYNKIHGISVSANFSFSYMDGWKIQGYWYTSFCVLLYHLWYAGIRGDVKFNEEQNQDFVIRFEEDDIYVDFYPLGGYNEEGDACEEQDLEIEETVKLREINGQDFKFPEGE
jgi:hypothetical protein